MPDFIPKQYKREPITIRIDFEKLEKIDKLASEYDLSRSEFINQCINYALDHITELEKQSAEECTLWVDCQSAEKLRFL